MIIENDHLICHFDQRGAALKQLTIKSLRRNIIRPYENLKKSPHYTNTIIGPIANRISGAKLSIDDEQFILDANENGNTLHGGKLGLSELEWEIKFHDIHSIVFKLEIDDRHMGFPGPSSFETRYSLENHSLGIEINAISPRKNAFNLIPHILFNLDEQKNTNKHLLQINADHFLPVNQEKIPTGTIQTVEGSEFDFRAAKTFNNLSIDHNFCLNGTGMRKIATLVVEDLKLEIESNQLGLQVFDAPHLGRKYILLEPQGWPNAVNHENFPSQIIDAKQPYQAISRYIFSTN